MERIVPAVARNGAEIPARSPSHQPVLSEPVYLDSEPPDPEGEVYTT